MTTFFVDGQPVSGSLLRKAGTGILYGRVRGMILSTDSDDPNQLYISPGLSSAPNGLYTGFDYSNKVEFTAQSASADFTVAVKISAPTQNAVSEFVLLEGIQDNESLNKVDANGNHQLSASSPLYVVLGWIRYPGGNAVLSDAHLMAAPAVRPHLAYQKTLLEKVTGRAYKASTPETKYSSSVTRLEYADILLNTETLSAAVIGGGDGLSCVFEIAATKPEPVSYNGLEILFYTENDGVFEGAGAVRVDEHVNGTLNNLATITSTDEIEAEGFYRMVIPFDEASSESLHLYVKFALQTDSPNRIQILYVHGRHIPAEDFSITETIPQ